MEKRGCIITALVLIFQEAVGFSIRNEQLGRCLQPLEDGLTLEECRPGSATQEWEWSPHTQALVSVQTGECLSVRGDLDPETVLLEACRVEDGDSQAWGCSRKGHLTPMGTNGLHLSVLRDAAQVILSRERGRSSKWRTLGNRTVCDESGGPHHRHHHSNKPTPTPSADTTSADNGTDDDNRPGPSAMAAPTPAESGPDKERLPLPSSPADPDLGWKVALLVLSALALLIGMVVLLLNIYYNRKKKVMCVVKSCVPAREVSQQGSPVPNERAPLTRNPMRPPHSPSLQRGEILIEWKDGSVTPLFDANTLLSD